MFTRYCKVVFAFALATLTSLAVRAADVIELSSSEFPPYMSQKMTSGGLVVAIATEAFKRSGYTLKVDYMPWARALEAAKQGKAVAGIAGLWKSKEREQSFIFSTPLFSNQVGFFRRASDKISYKDLSELKQYTIGTVHGYANPQAFTDAKLKTDEVNDDETNLIKLGAGRIDLVLVERGVAYYLMVSKDTQLMHQIVWVEPAIEKFPMHIAISNKTPDAAKKIEAFNQGLSAMEKDGTLAKMLKDANI